MSTQIDKTGLYGTAPGQRALQFLNSLKTEKKYSIPNNSA